MDKLLYVAMTGAKETLRAQATNNHNLANASTTGFRADLEAFQSRTVAGSGFASRVYATNGRTGWDDTAGSLVATGRALDVAVQGKGFIAVQGRDGREAYTRAGDLRVDPSGLLLTGAGHPVLGDGGPITVPPHTAIEIGSDGTLSVVPQGSGPETTAAIGRIKLVAADPAALVRGEDALFHPADGAPVPADATVRLATGVLESSNVNVAEAMVQMIELSRHFELQVKAMRTAEENAAAAAQLLRVT